MPTHTKPNILLSTVFSLSKFSLLNVNMINWFFLDTAQKMKFSIKDFFSKCDQIRSFLPIWSHLLKKFLMENFIICAVEDATD